MSFLFSLEKVNVERQLFVSLQQDWPVAKQNASLGLFIDFGS